MWHLDERLDVDRMRDAAPSLVGTHDFAALHSTGSETTGTIRTVFRSALSVMEVGQAFSGSPRRPDRSAPLLAYEITGDGFLRHMVRAIVGTLVEIGRGSRPTASMADLIAGGRRADAGATAPAHGLFLVRVDYD